MPLKHWPIHRHPETWSTSPTIGCFWDDGMPTTGPWVLRLSHRDRGGTRLTLAILIKDRIISLMDLFHPPNLPSAWVSRERGW